MTTAYDFAIFGSSPLSALLAGLLAHDHGRQVLRVAEPVSPQRLPRAIDIALPLATRPETWRLLAHAEAETTALLRALEAADAVSPVEVKLVADQPGTAAALAHMSHIGLGYGMAARDSTFWRVPRLVGEITLADSRVTSIAAAELNFSKNRVELVVEGEAAEVRQIVLADDAAILALLPEEQRPGGLQPQAMTATLTQPTRRLAAPVMRFPDRGVTLAQRPDGAVLGLVAGDREVEARLASTLPGSFPLPRRASSHFRRLVSSDGAPVIGALASGPLLLAALGSAGAFLAPPLARFLAGKASDEERAFFAAHAPGDMREAVADVVEALP